MGVPESGLSRRPSQKNEKPVSFEGKLAFCFAELGSALPALLLLNRVGLRCAPLSCFQIYGDDLLIYNALGLRLMLVLRNTGFSLQFRNLSAACFHGKLVYEEREDRLGALSGIESWARDIVTPNRRSLSRAAEPRNMPERTANSRNHIEIVAVHERQDERAHAETPKPAPILPLLPPTRDWNSRSQSEEGLYAHQETREELYRRA